MVDIPVRDHRMITRMFEELRDKIQGLIADVPGGEEKEILFAVDAVKEAHKVFDEVFEIRPSRRDRVGDRQYRV